MAQPKQKEGKVTEYSGPAGALKAHSKWLGVEDLPLDKDTVVTIESSLTLEDVPLNKGQLFSGGGLSFVGAKKRWILNSGNRKILCRLFTSDTAKWKGKRISLYVNPDVTYGKTKTGGIEIRDKAAEQHSARARELAEPQPPSNASDNPELCGKPCGDTNAEEPEYRTLDMGHDGACEPEQGEQ